MTVRELIAVLAANYCEDSPVYVRCIKGDRLIDVEPVQVVVGGDPRWPNRVFIDGVSE